MKITLKILLCSLMTVAQALHAVRTGGEGRVWTKSPNRELLGLAQTRWVEKSLSKDDKESFDSFSYWAFGADVNGAQDSKGRRAIHLAASSGFLHIVKFLVKSQWEGFGGATADITIRDSDGRQALHYAAENGHFDVALFLINKGADLYTEDNNGRQPLHYAAENGHFSMIESLLMHGVPLNGEALFAQEQEESEEEKEKEYEDQRARSSRPLDQRLEELAQLSPIIYALHRGDDQTVSELLESVSLPRRSCQVALQMATRTCKLVHVESLLIMYPDFIDENLVCDLIYEAATDEEFLWQFFSTALIKVGESKVLIAMNQHLTRSIETGDAERFGILYSALYLYMCDEALLKFALETEGYLHQAIEVGNVEVVRHIVRLARADALLGLSLTEARNFSEELLNPGYCARLTRFIFCTGPSDSRVRAIQAIFEILDSQAQPVAPQEPHERRLVAGMPLLTALLFL